MAPAVPAIVPPSRPNDAAGQHAAKYEKYYRKLKGSEHCLLLSGANLQAYLELIVSEYADFIKYI